MTEQPEYICLSADMWLGYDLDNNGAFLGVEHEEYPDIAARLFCAKHWTAGDHNILVCGLGQAWTYTVKVESNELDPAFSR